MHPGVGRRDRRPVTEWLTIDETADRLGYDAGTVFGLVVAGWLPTVYVRWEFLVPDVALDDVTVP